MNRRNLIIGAMVLVVVAGATLAYFLRPAKEASEEVQENTEQLTSENEAQSVFRISQDASEVSFSIDEVLRGNPTTAVGTTSKVAGDIVIDGGNSYFKDDVRRARQLSATGIHYVDAGTSGGVWGRERG